MPSMTLLDWSRRVGPDGSIDDIAELLSQCNEVFKDMIWREGNLPTGHKSTVRTGLPTGTWRALNMGVAYSKSTTAQLESGVGQLTAWSQVDKTLADLEGQTGELRMSEDNAFLEGMSQTMATTLFYGNQATTPTQFTGFSPYYNTTVTTSAQSARNVLSGGGTGSANTSIWLIGWGDSSVFGIFPKGTRAGLIFEDRGDVVPAYDSNSNPYRAYTSYFEWNAGLFVKDWRYIVRMCNIDTTTAGLAGASPPDLFAMMSKAVVRLPTAARRVSGITETDAPGEPSPGINPAFYCNRTGREYLDLQAIRDRNVLLTPREYAGEPVLEFRQVPIRVNDCILNSEATIS